LSGLSAIAAKQADQKARALRLNMPLSVFQVGIDLREVAAWGLHGQAGVSKAFTGVRNPGKRLARPSRQVAGFFDSEALRVQKRGALPMRLRAGAR
jgi:hypothetical protein